MPYWFPNVLYCLLHLYVSTGWWKVPKKKKILKTLQKDERMISPSLSLSLSLSLLTQVNMSTPNIGKHAGQTCWTCSLWNNETKPVIFFQTFTKEITSVIFSPLDKDNLQLLWLCSQQTCLKSHGWL